MNNSYFGTPAVQSPAVSLARLSGPHGYRLEGDEVSLNASVEILASGACDTSWALQLWACPTAPTSAWDLAGHIVAEVALPAMAEPAGEDYHFEVKAAAWPPAGAGAYVMALGLTSGQSGQFSQVHDLAVFPDRQQFIQPRMTGNVGYRVDGASARISVERVENPREAANRSGTLSLELWALPVPFTGGAFQGHHLAGVEIGPINGQCDLALESIDLAFIPPPPGEWHVVLMLREWTTGGYVTRDFTNFPTRFTSAPVAEDTIRSANCRAEAPAPVVEAPAPVVEAPAPVAEAPAPVAEAPAPVAEAPAPVAEAPAPVAEGSSPIVENVVAVTVAKAPRKKATKASEPRVPKGAALPSRARKSGANETKISVNTASVEELAAVKGLSRKVAEGIAKQRPFKSLDDIRQVKGLSAKVFAGVLPKLKV
jgi:hypothetical protein